MRFPSLRPSRFRPDRLAAVDSMDPTRAASPIPKGATYTARQIRAHELARRIGFIGRSYRFVAWQGARCPLRPEHLDPLTSQWVPVTDARHYSWFVLEQFSGVRSTQADLVRQGLYLDDTAGECRLVLDEPGTETSPQRWSIRSPQACLPKTGRLGTRQAAGYEIQLARGGTVDKGTALWLPANRVYRHWQASEEYELEATSSLIEMLDEVEHYYSIARMIRRKARQQIAVGGFWWTPASAHAKKRPNSEVSELDYQYANAAAAALNDYDDADVVSVAPIPIHTDGSQGHQLPQHIAIPGVDSADLEHLRDARMAVADSLPLASSSVISAAEGNHWNEWLASEEDAEVISDRLTRFTASITRAMFRPNLQYLFDADLLDGEPETFRIGFDLDPIRRRPDNSANVETAARLGAIGYEAIRRELHFSEDDAPSEEEAQQIAAFSRALQASRSPEALPVGSTQPQGGAPEPPEQLASLPGLVDDRWALVRASD